ncbi:unnamed protein product, partial [Owenia fusiformis]
ENGQYNYNPPKCVLECPPGKCCKSGKWYWPIGGRGYQCKVLPNGPVESKQCPYCQVFDVEKCGCVDVEIQCKAVQAPDNGYIVYADRNCDGRTKFACNVGYKLVGYAEIKCLENGQYNYNPPKCVPECPPGKCCKSGKWYWPIGGRYYKCKVLPNGNVESKQCPYCKVFNVEKCDCIDAEIQCSSVQAPQNGYVSNSDRNCGDRTKFNCNGGYKLVGYAEIKCLENGQYNYNPPKCV